MTDSGFPELDEAVRKTPVMDSIRRTALGVLGTGKTLNLVRNSELFNRRNPHEKIISNVDLSSIFGSKNFQPLESAGMLFDIDYPCFLGGDEWWSLCDSRKGWSVINDVTSMLMIRSRKKHWQVELNEQYVSMMDKRVRAVQDIVTEPCMRMDGWEIVRSFVPHPYVQFDVFRYDAVPFFEDYDHEADPLSLNIEELKERWKRFKKDRNVPKRKERRSGFFA